MQKSRALVIAPQPFFTPRGTPFSVYYRTLVMSEMGVDVDLITYGEGQDVEIPGVRIHRIPRFGMFGHVKIGPSPLKLFLDLFLFMKVFIFLCRRRYDFVHAHEEAVFFCVLLKPLFGFRLIYDMHSSLPQQLTNFNFTTFKPLIRIFQVLEDLSLKASDAIITICPDLADYVNRVITDRSKHVMIENSIFDPVKVKVNSGCAPETEAAPDPRQDISDWLAGKHPVVVYAGTLEAYQGIDTLIESFRIVIGKVPAARLLIVGGTEIQVAQYSGMAEQLGLHEVIRFTGRVPQKAAQTLTKASQVQVSPRSTGTNTPLKIYEQLASGIPLVATNIYSHTQAIDASVAFLVDPDTDGMAEGIIAALTSEASRKKKTAAARLQYETMYARPAYASKLRKIVRKVL